ncbi:type IV toxin-antitoxin system AbiEi family antitoxin domain-containing protein [Austwickia chelonae]|uniref:DUF559 domain-containing protein n=1 Tax=Austwickia chelonae NBRC 105200 TaxID=1184607 RepID=K6UNU5_9MICO|nr:type IV toxin-antitoxin system AbiEi family antitoxin domain-containing protein [Austwickia chelonae]GAB79261.1 hypothetical protein AUCHE_22_00310 [Austwickia chelonae NBRC 105200]
MHDDDLLAALARRDSFTRTELLALGVDGRRLHALLGGGQLVRLCHGRYGTAITGLTPEEEHLRLAAAVLRRYRGSALLSHHSALADAGLPLYSVPYELAYLTSRAGRYRRRRSDHVLHAADPSTVGTDGGSRVGLHHALVQTGLRWGPKSFLVPADVALGRGLVTMTQLAEAIEDYRRCPGLRGVRAAFAQVDPSAESPGESLLRWLLFRLGYRTRSQVVVHTAGRGYRIDLVIEQTRVAVEFDGMGKYGSAADLRAEKARDEDLQAAGWSVVHLTWPDLSRAEVVDRRVRAALAWQARAAVGGR